VRRQFYEIQVKTPAPIATRPWSASPHSMPSKPTYADERSQARQRRTKPLLDDLRLWLEPRLAASGKSTIAGAIRYAPRCDTRVIVPSSQVACNHWDLVFWIELIPPSRQ